MGSQQIKVLTSEEIRILVELGFLACGAGNTTAARKIFDGLRMGREDKGFAVIGAAMSMLEAGAAGEAVSLMRSNYLSVGKTNNDYQAFFAVCLIAAGHRHEAERTIKDLLAHSGPPDAAHRLASALQSKFLTNRNFIRCQSI